MPRTQLKLIIFDFDGVVADSELIGSAALADHLTRAGLKTSTEEALRFYLGRRWLDCVALMEERLGRPLPGNFLNELILVVHSRVLAEVVPVRGIESFLHQFAAVPRCIASSSRLDYIGDCLDRMRMASWFEHRFSGHDVARGKPHPDLFLKAATALGARPPECLVIEDSVLGIRAGKAAGMQTIGLCAGSHILDEHPARLLEAGADAVVKSYQELAQLAEKRFDAKNS